MKTSLKFLGIVVFFLCIVIANSEASNNFLTLSKGEQRYYKIPDKINDFTLGDENIVEVKKIDKQIIRIIGKQSGATNIIFLPLKEKQELKIMVVDQPGEMIKEVLLESFKRIPELSDINVELVGENILITGTLPTETSKMLFDKIMKKYTAMTNVINLVKVSSKLKQFNAGIIKESIGIEGVEVRLAEDKLYLIGEVYSEADKKKAEDVAKNYFENVINLLIIKRKVVKLKIKVVEINRSKLKEFYPTASNLTSNFTFTEGKGQHAMWSFSAGSNFITNLNWWITNGWAKIMSNPEILTISDEEAKFVSGGEISYTVLSTDGTPSTEWKEYGLISKIIPTLLKDNKIKLKIDVEVSELVPTASDGQLNLSKSNVSTSLITSPDKNVVIAGIYRTRKKNIKKHVPLIGNLPLFNFIYSKKDQGIEETESVIIINPSFAYIEKEHYDKLLEEEEIKGKVELEGLELK